jgi:DNA-binding beta-propeller fold protein YncE
LANAQANDYLKQWGTYGSGDGQFNDPQGVVVDGSGNLYVADAGNFRIQEFTNNGDYLTKWGASGRAHVKSWVIGVRRRPSAWTC